MGELETLHSLMDAGVVDEVRMLVCPASRGKGTRVFEDRQHLKVVEGAAVLSRLRWVELCSQPVGPMFFWSQTIP